MVVNSPEFNFVVCTSVLHWLGNVPRSLPETGSVRVDPALTSSEKLDI